MKKDGRSHAFAGLATLPVEGQRIVAQPEQIDQLGVADEGWIEIDLNDLYATGMRRAVCSRCVPNARIEDSFDLAKIGRARGLFLVRCRSRRTANSGF